MRILFAALAFTLTTSALAAPPLNFDARVDSLRKEFGIPSVSVAVVENGRTTLAKGYGVEGLSVPRRVDADTIFSTGSTGKAFTAAALAILVDRGKLGWDDKIIDHMPEFRMYDAWVTREMTVRDLLVHRSGLGLGAGDLLFFPRSDLSRKETMHRLRFIKPATSFRSAYAYDNILYAVAGQLVEEVSGETWETFVRRNIFAPLGMRNSTVNSAGLLASKARARPHARLSGAVRGLGEQVQLGDEVLISDNAASAGGLAISANDMSKWIQVQLARGKLPDGSRLFSEAASREMWSPVTIMPIGTPPEPLTATKPTSSAYALGWEIEDYKGTRIVWHGGAVFGSLAAVVLVPDRNLGFYLAVGSEDGQLIRGLMFELLDHYLGQPKASWPEKYHAFKRASLAKAAGSVNTASAARAKVGPSLPLARYTGDFTDPWYGTIKIRADGAKLRLDFPHSRGMTATLDHRQYDTFQTIFPDRSYEPAFVTFSLDPDGKIDRITMKPVSPTADFSWDYQDLLFTPATATAGAK